MIMNEDEKDGEKKTTSRLQLWDTLTMVKLHY